MVDISTQDPNLHRLHAKSSSAPVSDPQSSPPLQGADALVACVYFLMELSSISAHKANIDAKQLSSNAAKQEELNRQGAKLQWYSVPTQITAKHQQIKHYHTYWTWAFWKDGMFVDVRTTIETITVNKSAVAANLDAINAQQSKNQQLLGQRQILTENVATLQQNAQTGETKINMVVNDGMQSITIRSNLLQTVESLTFTALMRRPPR